MILEEINKLEKKYDVLKEKDRKKYDEACQKAWKKK